MNNNFSDSISDDIQNNIGDSLNDIGGIANNIHSLNKASSSDNSSIDKGSNTPSNLRTPNESNTVNTANSNKENVQSSSNSALSGNSNENHMNDAGLDSSSGYGMGSNIENGTEAGIEAGKDAASAAESTAEAVTETGAGASSGGIGTAVLVALHTARDLVVNPEETFTNAFSIIAVIISPIILLVFIMACILHMSFPSMSAKPTEIEYTKIGNIKTNYDVKSRWNTLISLFNFNDGSESYKKITELPDESSQVFNFITGDGKSAYMDTLKEACEGIQNAFSYYKKDAKSRLTAYLSQPDNEYLDKELTMESFNNCKNPFGDDYLNINYAEIISIMTLTEEWNIKNLDQTKFKEFIKNSEQTKYLYQETVHVQWQKKSKDESGNTIWKNIEGIGEQNNSDYRAYGVVKIEKYSLAQIFKLFGVNPYEMNYAFTSTTNIDLLEYQKNLIKVYKGKANLGIEDTTPMTSTLIPSEIINVQIDIPKDVDVPFEFITPDDFDSAEVITGEGYLKIECPYYNQGDYRGKEKYRYGQGDIQSSGCCLISSLMIAECLTGIDILQPKSSYDNWIAYFCDPANGYLTGGYITSNSNSSKFVLKEFGISYTGQHVMSLQGLIDELDSTKTPVMIHYKIGKFTKSGHFSVCTGYDLSKKIFFTNDPGRRARTEVSFDDMANECTYYRTYAKN